MDGSLFVLGSFVMACCATVKALPRAGESLFADSVTAEPGGKGFNVAVCARRLGVEVACLAAVGDDLFGRLAAPAFVAAGLPTTLLRTVPGAATGAGIGFIAPGGENCLAVYPGANLALRAADIHAHADAIRAATLCFAGFELGDEPILVAFAVARGAGARTILNPSPFRPVPLDLLALTSLIVVNEREGAALALSLGLSLDASEPGSVQALGDRLEEAGVEGFVLTLGVEGVVAAMRGMIIRQAGFEVATLDTLGAGDAFSAAMAATLAAGGSMSAALERGAAAGALTATRPGTFTAFPTAAEVDALSSVRRR